MKNAAAKLSLLLIVGLLIYSNTSSYSSVPGSRVQKRDSIPDSYFIPITFMSVFDLREQPSGNEHMHIWNSENKDAAIVKVNDIRIAFDTRAKARKFFKKHLTENSENSLEIHPGFGIPGADMLHVYKESDAMAKLNRQVNVNLHYYFFLFLVDRVYVKVFIAASPETTIQEVKTFAVEASNDVKRNLLK